jgi:mono/diheme cytochrome c family protein
LRPARRKPALLAALAATFAVLPAGCGRDDPTDLVNGKTLFTQRCGSCHELGRANTRGVTGPSLDAAFRAARQDGLGESTIEGIVRDQIANVRSGSVMPEDLVTGADARDVAAYVAASAARPGRDTGELASAGRPQAGPPVAARNGVLNIPADPTGALAFRSNKASAEAGTIEFVSPNQAPIQHNIAVKNGVTKLGPVVGNGGTSRFSVDLRPGRYTFFCSVPGHEAGGMKGELTVE